MCHCVGDEKLGAQTFIKSDKSLWRPLRSKRGIRLHITPPRQPAFRMLNHPTTSVGNERWCCMLSDIIWLSSRRNTWQHNIRELSHAAKKADWFNSSLGWGGTSSCVTITKSQAWQRLRSRHEIWNTYDAGVIQFSGIQTCLHFTVFSSSSAVMVGMKDCASSL